MALRRASSLASGTWLRRRAGSLAGLEELLGIASYGVGWTQMGAPSKLDWPARLMVRLEATAGQVRVYTPGSAGVGMTTLI